MTIRREGSKMQFIDLKKQYNEIKEDVNRRIDNVLEHQHFIMGSEIEEMEQRLAKFTGRK